MSRAAAIISGGSGSAHVKIAGPKGPGHIEVAETQVDLGAAVQRAMKRRKAG